MLNSSLYILNVRETCCREVVVVKFKMVYLVNHFVLVNCLLRIHAFVIFTARIQRGLHIVRLRLKTTKLLSLSNQHHYELHLNLSRISWVAEKNFSYFCWLSMTNMYSFLSSDEMF